MTAFSAAGQGLSYAIMVLGVYITFKLLNFADMTCDGSFALGGCVSVVFTQSMGFNPFLSLLFAVAAGGAAGFVTGILNTKCKIPPILSGILTMIALYSINLHVMSGKANLAIQRGNNSTVDIVASIIPEQIVEGLKSTTMNYMLVLTIGIITVAILISLLYWFFGTEIGSAIRAAGDNEDMIRALGQNTDTVKIIALVLSNALISLSGAMISQQRRVADITSGQGAIVIGLASIVIGEVLFSKAVHSFGSKLVSIVAGSVIYQIVIAVVLFLGMPTTDLKLLTAAIVAAALSAPVLRGNVLHAISRRKAGGGSA